MLASTHAVSRIHTTNPLYTRRREWNEEIVRARKDTKVIELWQAHGREFSCVNISTALISFAKWNVTDDGQRCICSMLQYYTANAALMRVRDAASTVFSLTKLPPLGEEGEQTKQNLFMVIAKKVVGKSDFYDKPHLTSLVQLLQSFEHQGQEISPLLTAIEAQAIQCFATSTSSEEKFTQSVVELATFYSKKGHAAPTLFQVIQQHVQQTLHAYSTTQLLKIASACSSLGITSKEFYDATYRRIKRAVDTLDAAGIESCLYIYGQSVEKLALTKTLEVIITSKISTLSDQDLVSILASFAIRQIGSDSFFQAMECEAMNRIEGFTPRSITSIISSFAKALASSYSFFSHVEKKVIETLELFETKELVQIYHAYSVSRLAGGKFLLKIEDEIRSRSDVEPDLDPQSVTILIWSMLLARSIEAKYLTVLLNLLNQACEDNNLKGIHPQTFIDIDLMIKADAPELIYKIKRPLANVIELSRQEMLKHKPESSSFQREVQSALQRCGYIFESQQFLDGVFVDIFIPSEKLAISVCDASHYYRTSQNELTALSLIKKRILETRGYKMIHLPHFEWSWPKQQQELYLKELFARPYKPIADLSY